MTRYIDEVEMHMQVGKEVKECAKKIVEELIYTLSLVNKTTHIVLIQYEIHLLRSIHGL